VFFLSSFFPSLLLAAELLATSAISALTAPSFPLHLRFGMTAELRARGCWSACARFLESPCGDETRKAKLMPSDLQHRADEGDRLRCASKMSALRAGTGQGNPF
jgi:hypothetical protein